MTVRALVRVCCVLLGALALAGAGGTAAGVAADNGPVADQDAVATQSQAEFDPDVTITRIRVHENGSATWSVTVRLELDSNQSVEEFEAFQAEFERNQSAFVSRFRDRMTGVVSNAATATNREMTATQFRAETGVEEVIRRWGYVTYRFRWEGFVPPESDTLTVGDVFQGGFFLEENDILIVEGPRGYETETVAPSADTGNRTQLQWDGPRSFADQRPRVTFAQPEDGSAGGDGSGSSGFPLPVVLVVLVAALVAIGVTYVRRKRGDGTTAAPADGEDESKGTAEQTTDSGAGAAAGDDLSLGELATDEDRVQQLLASEGGRMRQADIADRLDWSASKTSRVVSDMADEDKIEKLRIGRENVIDLVEDGADEEN